MSKDKAEEKEIINAPKKIYLQIGCKDYDCTIDFKELSDVTWSVDKIDSDDIEYVLSSDNAQLREALRDCANGLDLSIHYIESNTNITCSDLRGFVNTANKLLKE